MDLKTTHMYTIHTSSHVPHHTTCPPLTHPYMYLITHVHHPHVLTCTPSHNMYTINTCTPQMIIMYPIHTCTPCTHVHHIIKYPIHTCTQSHMYPSHMYPITHVSHHTCTLFTHPHMYHITPDASYSHMYSIHTCTPSPSHMYPNHTCTP